MLRKVLDWQLSLFEEGKPLHRLRPAVSALDTFCYEAPERTRFRPYIRDAVDLKRWMVLVVVALIPCIIMAIWNSGVQKYVYTSADFRVMDAYLEASTSFSGYFSFCFSEGRWVTILVEGILAFIPIMLISYLVGGICEVIFAVIRRHEVAEGFLVTGILFPLSLPSTIPYWMVAIGVAFGVIIGKELFGGTGMNILNPALTARVFLFFAYPAQMTGEVWAGTNPTVVANSLKAMNEQASRSGYDAYTQATPLGVFNAPDDVKRIHVDAIATNNLGSDVGTYGAIEQRFALWKAQGHEGTLGALDPDQMQAFVTGPLDAGGLGLAQDSYASAYQFSGLEHGLGAQSNWDFFFGNRLGSFGSTSILAAILGALFLLWMGVASWRTMLAYGIGAYVTALIFEFCSRTFGMDGGAWNIARYAFPAYKHLMLGALAFGLVFMATEPVSSPTMNRSKWFYGLLIGVVNILIRVINPAYPEGVMIAILFGNVFAPLFDAYSMKAYRRRKVAYATA